MHNDINARLGDDDSLFAIVSNWAVKFECGSKSLNLSSVQGGLLTTDGKLIID